VTQQGQQSLRDRDRVRVVHLEECLVELVQESPNAFRVDGQYGDYSLEGAAVVVREDRTPVAARIVGFAEFERRHRHGLRDALPSGAAATLAHGSEEAIPPGGTAPR